MSRFGTCAVCNCDLICEDCQPEEFAFDDTYTRKALLKELINKWPSHEMSRREARAFLESLREKESK
jgi:hypothetical protein